MELRRSKLNPKICQLARLPRFNLKVFKAIHHTYLRQANETLQRAPCRTRLQLDMSAAICCAIAHPLLGLPVAPWRIILACHKGAIRCL